MYLGLNEQHVVGTMIILHEKYGKTISDSTLRFLKTIGSSLSLDDLFSFLCIKEDDDFFEGISSIEWVAAYNGVRLLLYSVRHETAETVKKYSEYFDRYNSTLLLSRVRPTLHAGEKHGQDTGRDQETSGRSLSYPGE